MNDNLSSMYVTSDLKVGKKRGLVEPCLTLSGPPLPLSHPVLPDQSTSPGPPPPRADDVGAYHTISLALMIAWLSLPDRGTNLVLKDSLRVIFVSPRYPAEDGMTPPNSMLPPKAVVCSYVISSGGRGSG